MNHSKKILSVWLAAFSLTFISFFASAQSSKVGENAWLGSYSEMLQRGVIRIAVPYDLSIYINNKGIPQGFSVDMAKGLQTWINRQHADELRGKSVTVKLVPIPEHELYTSLSSGKADMVIGDLGINQPQQNSHEFLLNHASKLEREVLVSGPSSIPINGPEDLSGQTIYGGRNSNFPLTLQELNKGLKHKGKPPINIVSPIGDLDSEDLLDMVNSGLIPFVIVSDWKANLWKPIYKNIVIHDDIYVKDLGWIGWATRSSNPDLNNDIIGFVASDTFDDARKLYRQQEYSYHAKGLKNPIEKSAWARFESMRPFFDQFGAQYNLDPLFIASLGFQETLLTQSAVSNVGAIGVMQLMPATGDSMGVGNIRLLEPNIHAGADYLNQLITKFFPDAQFEGDNRSLFAIASYNIGPNNVAKARDQAREMGFDPNQWFRNVEYIATERMGYEPMVYVRNVYKYFISYGLKLDKIQGIQP